MHNCLKSIGIILLLVLLGAPPAFSQTENSTFIYSGQINIPDNGYQPGDPVFFFPNNHIDGNLSTGWHDLDVRFDNAITDSFSDSGSIPEPSSFILLSPLALLLRRR